MTACQVRGYCPDHGDPFLRPFIRRVVSDVAPRGGERQRMAGAASFAAARSKGSFRCTRDGLQPRRDAAECSPPFTFAAPAAADDRWRSADPASRRRLDGIVAVREVRPSPRLRDHASNTQLTRGKVAAPNCGDEDASGSRPPLPTARHHGHATACEVFHLFPEPLCAVARPDRNADGRDRRRSALRCLRH